MRGGRNRPGGGPTRGRRRAFLPTDLGQCQLWVRADRGITIATGVSQWADQSGLGHHLLQGTAGFQPLVTAANAGFNNCATVDFDGVDDLLQGAWTLPQPAQIYIVGQWNTAFAATSTIVDGLTGDTGRLMRVAVATLRQRGGGGAPVNNDQVAQTPQVKHFYTLDFNGASSQMKTDGVLQGTTANLGAVALGGITLGSFGTPFDFASASIAEVIVYGRVLSAGEEARVNALLKARYGL